MSTESKKRTASTSTSNPTSEGDHRKRRRNRTTQSCLNCHTSKRMCDRKRPCGRCTQLGLTGLCVYEVDDPTEREPEDESSRLIKRVAELESVIRELKNKPHPKWSKEGTSSGGKKIKPSSRKLPTIIVSEAASSSPDEIPPASPTSESVDSSDNGCLSPHARRDIGSLSPSIPASLSPSVYGDQSSDNVVDWPSPYFGAESPFSTPSPAILTPVDEQPPSHVSVSAHSPNALSQSLDLAALFSSYQSAIEYDMEISNHVDQPIQSASAKSFPPHAMGAHQMDTGHCGCLHDTTNYNILLELSLRLRKAADILGRSVNHRMGSSCLLNQRVAELDAFATTALGNIADTPLESSAASSSMHECGPSCFMAHTARQDQLSPMVLARPPQRAHASLTPAIPLPHTTPSDSWDFVPPVSNAFPTHDDTLLPWELPGNSH
ncbi:hypothetical protein PLICRDRAFT_50945 [Plicaturopsis crispa FD-325 SS-3]|nr:hypothetical protein PLICRDRAFT_50945 [Plicaturopsis crispa FD-325 SS-3]